MAIIADPPTMRPLPRRWQQELKEAIRDADQLCHRLGLPTHLARAAQASARQFPVFAPRSYVDRMRPGDPDDPLLRQVLPLAAEAQPKSSSVQPAAVPEAERIYQLDPVDDLAAALVPGLLKKYAGRALMITTGACAVHCRYCFRRHFPYDETPRSLADWEPAFAALAADPTINEVILSGGDPLTLVDPLLASLAERLSGIAHLRRLRIHTRLPIMIPERVTPELIDWLRGTRLTPWMVVHANHPAELDDTVAEALARLIDAGIPVLNQAVLLRGVNDSVETLVALSERLVELRVQPYYLHQLDRVLGAAHFEVPVDAGRALVAALRARLPGYAVPQYVAEIPGASSKTPL
ncbi:MAG: EF-P beta-lysylation protein EpmB [Planctomycetes bacterium]|nr:EF-P beta-lysylation protein EpmB [Planctomycetota bacterium]